MLRKSIKAILATLHLLEPARKLLALKYDLRRVADLFMEGMNAFFRKTVKSEYKSPAVREQLSCLAPSRSEIDGEQYLSIDNPKLNALYERYRENTPYLRITSPLWHEIPKQLDLYNFRSHCGYLWTTESAFRYKMTARYISRFDHLGLLRLFGEDGAFGCQTYPWNGMEISRDKLDSIMEIYYVMARLGIGPDSAVKVLDIGAGYGRLAHRFTTLFKRSEYYCVDAIPISTFLCDFYLKFRRVTKAHVVPFDNLETLSPHHFDLAINVHSFHEQTSNSIECWMSLLDSLHVKRLMIVDQKGRWSTMEPPDNRWSSYFPILQKHGWTLIDARPKYGTLFGHVCGIYPEAVHSLFARS